MNGVAGLVSAPFPSDEAARLARLQHLDVLDSPAEATFDEIVRLAAIVCGTPVALLSFVDTDRQWFKATHGWDVASTPRDVALCAYTILEDVDFVVEDVPSTSG